MLKILNASRDIHKQIVYTRRISMNGKIVHGFVLMTIVFVAFITLSWAEPISWENLTVDQIEALRTVQSIRIVVKCFGDLDQCEKLKINELIESKLQAAGVSVAKADDPNFQTSITVELNATALGSSYIGRGQASQYHYRGLRFRSDSCCYLWTTQGNQDL
jgi:hypothetical protein